jgi:adenylylsulfate kinase
MLTMPTVWFTGLSSAGKTTLCQAVAVQLREQGMRCEILDGDVVRTSLCADLGFSKEDRVENVRRIAEAAERLTRGGAIVLVAAISPYRLSRQRAREALHGFIEVYVNAPLAVCEARDVKGLYRQARAGGLSGFTGIDDPYEAPENPDVECRTDRESLEESARKVCLRISESCSHRWRRWSDR